MTNKEKFLEVFHLTEDTVDLRECPVYCTGSFGYVCKHRNDTVCMGEWWNDEYKYKYIDYSLFAEFKEKLSKWMYHNSDSVCGNSMIDIDYLEGYIEEILYEMGVIGEVGDGNDENDNSIMDNSNM